jgi:hypothetical protein
VRVAAVVLGVVGRTSEHLGQPRRDAMRMLLRHVGEQRAEELVLANARVEGGGQALERLLAANPLIQRRDGHPR